MSRGYIVFNGILFKLTTLTECVDVQSDIKQLPFHFNDSHARLNRCFLNKQVNVSKNL